MDVIPGKVIALEIDVLNLRKRIRALEGGITFPDAEGAIEWEKSKGGIKMNKTHDEKDATITGWEARKKSRQRFWFCYVDGQGTPAQKHYSEVDAEVEAQRLAQACEKDVFVLEAGIVARYIPPMRPLVVEWQKTVV